MKVVEFGGSSVALSAKIVQITSILNNDNKRQVVVVSTPGRRSKSDTKVTGLLIKYANLTLRKQNCEKIQTQIYARYAETGKYFDLSMQGLNEIKALVNDLPTHTFPNRDYSMAAFKAHGEFLSAKLLTMITKEQGFKVRPLTPRQAGLVVTDSPSDASVNPETYVNLHNLELDPTEKIIFPGLYGISPSGNIATFSHGGSDIAGAILAHGFTAELYGNFTDIDVIFSTNPAIVSHPQPISKIAYREMRELSHAGFSVFYDEALTPAIQAQIPVNVKSTQHPKRPGTMIVPETNFKAQRTITGIAGGKNFAALYLRKYLLNKGAGFTLKILQILDQHKAAYEHVPSGIDDITIIFKKEDFNAELIDQICNEIQVSLNPDQMQWIDDYAITMVVGEGIRDKLSLCASISYLLGQKDISIRMINQGASRISVMIGTRRGDAEEVIRTIHQTFFN